VVRGKQPSSFGVNYPAAAEHGGVLFRDPAATEHRAVLLLGHPAATKDGAVLLLDRPAAAEHGAVLVLGDPAAAEHGAVLFGHPAAAQHRALRLGQRERVISAVAGSEIAFADRGRHQLTGICDPWPVFAVTGTLAVLAGPAVADGSGGEQQDRHEEGEP